MMVAEFQLAAQPRIVPSEFQEVEQLFLVQFAGVKPALPGRIDIDVTCRAGTHPATDRLHAPGIFAQDFHQAIAGLAFDLMNIAEAVCHSDADHCNFIF